MESLEGEFTDIRVHKCRKHNKLKAGVETDRYEEAEKPITMDDLQETLPSLPIQDKEYEDIEIEGEEASSQITGAADTNDEIPMIDTNDETVEASEVQNQGETLSGRGNQEIESGCTDFEGSEKPQFVVTDDADVNQNLNSPKPLVVQDIKESLPLHANQENREYISIDESNNHSQNAMAAEANLVRKQEVVKPTAARVVKEALPGRAKRESLEYTDIERPKNRPRNMVTAGDDLNRYEEARNPIEYDEKESQVKEDEPDEFFDVEGFEFYEPNALESGIHPNRFQEAKTFPAHQVVTENVPNRFLKDGNRAKFAAESQPGQSFMPGKSNTQVRIGYISYVPQNREGLKKFGGASVVTLQDLVVPTPFEMCRSIKLKLKTKAKDKSEPEAIQEAKACIEDIFQNSEADLDLVEDSEQEAMERNEKLLDDIFDGIERRIRLLRADVMKKFRTLNPKQKKEVVKFWKGVEEFLDILLDWINKMFLKVLENIRQGSVIEKDALKKIFERVSAFLKVIFWT